jgi:hypothetical protein
MQVLDLELNELSVTYIIGISFENRNLEIFSSASVASRTLTRWLEQIG